MKHVAFVAVLALAGPHAALRAQDTSTVTLHLTLEEGAHTGRAAPTVMLPYATADSAGPASQPFDLAKELGHVVILVFYNGDAVPGATAAWRAFGAHEIPHLRADLVVAGVSRDGVMAHVAFARATQLPFKFLSDTSRLTARKYGMARQSFAVVVVGRDGRVVYVAPQFAPTNPASYVPLDAVIRTALEH